MKKRILALLSMACLVVSLAACSSNTTQEGTTSGETAGSSGSAAVSSEGASSVSSEASSSDMPSLEESFATDAEEVQSMLDAVQAQYADQGISVDLYAEGDEMHYDFTIESAISTEEERSVMTEALKAGTEATGQTYYDLAASVKESVSNDVVVVVLTFFDSEGNELYTQSFSSADAAAE